MSGILEHGHVHSIVSDEVAPNDAQPFVEGATIFGGALTPSDVAQTCGSYMYIVLMSVFVKSSKECLIAVAHTSERQTSVSFVGWALKSLHPFTCQNC